MTLPLRSSSSPLLTVFRDQPNTVSANLGSSRELETGSALDPGGGRQARSDDGATRLAAALLLLGDELAEAMRSGKQVLAHYRKRGTFEDRLGEFNKVIGPHLSSREFAENEVTMLLAMLAFNMTTMLRNEFEAAVGGGWDLKRFQQSVLRAGGRVVKGARRLWLHIEESVGSF